MTADGRRSRLYRFRRTYAIVRVVAGAVIVAAIVGQLVYSLSFRPPDATAFLVNFFSFFTILSNVIAAVVVLLGAWFQWTRPGDPRWYPILLAAAVTYMATTGIVYNTLLREVSLDQAATLGWSNEVLHAIAPAYMVVVWFLAPNRGRVPWRRSWMLLIFPVAWAIYTMIRGAVTGWYPYPFLNPAQDGGYLAVTAYVVGIAVAIGLIGAVVVVISRLRIHWYDGDAADSELA